MRTAIAAIKAVMGFFVYHQKPSVPEKLKQKKDAVEEQKKLPPLPQRETGRDHTTLE